MFLMKNTRLFRISLFFLFGAVACVTWVRDETNPRLVGEILGRDIQTNKPTLICLNTSKRRTKFSTKYLMIDSKIYAVAENRVLLEKCPTGTKGKVIRVFKERDSGQFIWDYVEFEMNDPRLKQKYRIVRMLGLHGEKESYQVKDLGGDFR